MRVARSGGRCKARLAQRSTQPSEIKTGSVRKDGGAGNACCSKLLFPNPAGGAAAKRRFERRPPAAWKGGICGGRGAV